MPSVELSALLDEVAAFYRRFVVFQRAEQADALALWTLHTHVAEASDVAVYVHVSSPVKGSGKSRVLEVADLLVANAYLCTDPSQSSLFRLIDAEHPTILIDEVDAVFGRDAKTYEGLRAILNAGHRRGAAVARVVGEGKDLKVKRFDVFGPKLLAGIGGLPDTIADRSIPISLARKGRHERLDRFRRREVQPLGRALRDRLSAWGPGAVADLEAARPEFPEELDDRPADVWEPLLAIADHAGHEWGKRARSAAVALSGRQEREDDADGVRVLSDIRVVFGETTVERMETSQLLAKLFDIESSPWAAWWGNDQVRDSRAPASKLARLLKPFGIHPVQWREGARGGVRGYDRTAFLDAWERYLPPVEDQASPSNQDEELI